MTSTESGSGKVGRKGKSSTTKKGAEKVIDVELKSKGSTSKRKTTRKTTDTGTSSRSTKPAKKKKSGVTAKVTSEAAEKSIASKSAKSTNSKKESSSKRKTSSSDERKKKANDISSNKSSVTVKSSRLSAASGATPSGPVSMPGPEALLAFQRASKRCKEELQKKAQATKKTCGKFLSSSPRKGKQYAIDLRIHSPGTVGYFSTGGVEAGAALVRLAKVKELDVIAVTDYYNASFIDTVKAAADETAITVIPGFDMRCRLSNCREVFIVALFPDSFNAEDVFRVITELGIPAEAYGRYDYCFEGSFESLLSVVEKNSGVVIPSRLDKNPYRQLSIPVLVEDFGIHAFDLVHPEQADFFKDRWPGGEFTFFSFSNANSLAQIGSRVTEVKLAAPGFEGVKARVQRRA